MKIFKALLVVLRVTG